MSDEILFYYERTRKQQAGVLALNMMLLPLVLLGLLLLMPEGQANYQQFFNYLLYILIAAEVVLTLFIIWFLTHPAKFFIKLTEKEFSSSHPTFKEWTFSVNPQAVVEIKHRTDRDARSSLILIEMQDGSSCLLSPNYAYDRNKLYEVLVSIKPDIKVPKRTWLFSNS